MIEISEASSPLVRTWFGDDTAWDGLVAAVKSPEARGIFANIQIVDDVDAQRLSLDDLAALHPEPTGISVVIVADRQSMSEPDYPLLMLLADGDVPPKRFRVIATELYDVEVNVFLLANLDWDDYANHVGADGVFRGFSR